jgi:hypothetical protein
VLPFRLFDGFGVLISFDAVFLMAWVISNIPLMCFAAAEGNTQHKTKPKTIR